MAKVVSEEIYKKDVELVTCHWNTTAINDCPQIYEALLSNNPVQVNLVGENFNNVVKVRVPSQALKIVDQENNVLYGDILCLNEDDENDCTLYYQYDIKPHQYLTSFKLLPTLEDDVTARVVEAEEVEVSETIQLRDYKPFKLSY